MVRWLKTDIGAIGFHALPRHVEDDSLYQTDDELGTRLSGGCQRQADLDVDFTWDFAQIGTKVVVLWPAAATSSRGPVGLSPELHRTPSRALFAGCRWALTGVGVTYPTAWASCSGRPLTTQASVPPAR